ncbi:MAG: hypothetical protein JST47_10195 [Bacteroidetes bacterium]|nr:hypothetical protein [Bacteroidota bacterium]MBS1973573.1 hypothetical protein [Bacteroidota bacterium]
MKRAALINAIFFFIFLIFFDSCTRNETHYYPDISTNGLSIFSNTGNNAFSCLINGQPWRTVNRTSGWGGTRYEVRMAKLIRDSLNALLTITWQGNFLGYDNSYGGYISLNFSVPVNFSINDFNSWQGKRLIIDGVNNYFEAQLPSISGAGKGTVYFDQAFLQKDSAGFSGRISGLLEAELSLGQLTSGRFDHILDPGNVYFYY